MKLGKIMGPAYHEILNLITKQGLSCTEKDVPFTQYNHLDWDRVNQTGFFAMVYLLFFHKWNIDMGIPCPESAQGEGRIKKLYVEEGKYVRMIHTGPYQKVGDTYKKIIEYAKKENLQLKNHSLEFYLNDPRNTPESELKTEVLVPV